MNELIVLGFFGKYITGPWMALLYGGDQISNLEAIPLLKTCFASVVQIFNYPNQLFNASLTAFGDEMPKDDCTFDSLHILYMSSDTDLIHSLAKQLAEGFTQVLEKQLQAYISGDILQKVPSALSAPVHNMYAERVLGMVDAQRHRAPNASMQFLDSKVKYTLNGTEEWLNTQENDIITYARKHARKAKCARKAKEESVNFEQECRLKAVHQRHDTKERKKLEITLKKLANSSEKPTVEELAKLLPDLNGDMLPSVLCLLVTPTDFCGRYFNHTWYEEESGQNKIYCGKFCKVTKKGKSFKTQYWSENESESEPYDICIFQLAVDLAFGELSML